jgi:chromosome segregation ATPase
MDENLKIKYHSEIGKFEERLISIRGEVETLERNRGVLNNEILEKEKYSRYLDETIKPKEEERDSLIEKIVGLNSDLVTVNESLKLARKEEKAVLVEIKEKKAELKQVISEAESVKEKNDEIANKLFDKEKELNERESLIAEKENMIKNFIKELE